MSMNPLPLLRATNAVLGRVAPRYTASRARAIFMRPRNKPPRPWESAVERSAQRVRLKPGGSALYWEGPRGTVLCLHGWQGRATQFGALAEQLLPMGLGVLAVDAPAHGRSPGVEAHPVAFARALLDADREYGPFVGVVGHSMGAGAAAIALSWGLRADKAVLMAPPASLRDVLARFARYVGLPKPALTRFERAVADRVGLPPAALGVDELAGQLAHPALIIHDKDDEAIPIEDGRAVAAAWEGSRFLELEGVGHYRIIRDPGVLEEITAFLAS